VLFQTVRFFIIRKERSCPNIRMVPFVDGHYLTVREAGYTQKEVSTGLNVSRIAVRNSLIRGEKNLDVCQQIWAKIG